MAHANDLPSFIYFPIFYVTLAAVMSHAVRSVVALNLTIVTYGVAVPGLLSGLALVEPAIKIGIEEITAQYGFNVSHVVLSSPAIKDCAGQLSHFDMVPEFYYEQRDRHCLFTIVTPGA